MSPSRSRLTSSIVLAVALAVAGSGLALTSANAVPGPAAHPEPAPLLLGTALSAAPLTAAAIGPRITRAQVMQNALTWLSQDPPYSQSRYYPGAMNPSTKYRTDCSGFVSMAWGVNVNLPGSISTGGYVTWTLPSIATRLSSTSLLQPGDILDYPYHHVILFTGWIDRTAGTFSYIAETMPGSDMQMSDTESVSTGNISSYPHTVFIPYRYVNIVASSSSGVRGDWDSNRTVDLLARGKGDILGFYAGNGAGGFRTGRSAPIASGQSAYVAEVRSPALSSGSLAPDLVAIDTTGALWIIPGTGVGSFGPRVQAGTGLTGYRLLAPGDVNRDGRADLLAISPTGELKLYKGTGAASFAAPISIGSGWSGMTAVAVGDFNSDGRPDILGDTAAGALNLYPGNGLGGFGGHVEIGHGWAGWKLLGPGDFSGDGHADLIGTDPAGDLWLYPTTGKATFGRRTHLGTHWSSTNLL